MILESTQILSTVSTEKGIQGPYRTTHKNHPCVRWVASNSANWAWLIRHASFMCLEYSDRYNRVHKCEALIKAIKDRSESVWRNSTYQNNSDYYNFHTPFVQCMPDKYKSDDAVEAYRAYYNGEKSKFAKWEHSKKPSWVLF